MTCPTCRTPWREQAECPRCRSDLSLLMRVTAAAWRHRRAAAAALAAGQWSAALHHAREAKHLHRTPAGDDLVVLARILVAGSLG